MHLAAAIGLIKLTGRKRSIRTLIPWITLASKQMSISATAHYTVISPADASASSAPAEKRVLIQLRGSSAAGSRQPVHIIFCIDVSGSMDGAKLQNVKDCINFVLAYMGPDDIISVVSFSSEARIYIKQMRTAPEALDTIRLTVSRIRVDGMTNIGAGLLAARDCLLPETEGQNHKQGILLLTDGIVNIGIQSPADLIALLDLVHTGHSTLTTTTVGYGTDHQAELLRAMATKGGGSYNIVQAREEAASVFGSIFGSMISCAAAGVAIQGPPQMKAHGPLASISGKLTVGDINADTTKTFVVDVPDSTTTLTVSGYDNVSKGAMTLTVDLVPADAAAERLIEMTMLRYEVAALLDGIKGYEQRDQLKVVAADLKTRVEALDVADPVVVLLADELKYIQALFLQPCMSQADVSMLTQHAAYVGMGVGTRGYSGGPSAHEADDVFSSPMSRMVSGGCRQMSQPTEPTTPPPHAPMLAPPPFPPRLARAQAMCYDSSGAQPFPFSSRQVAGGGFHDPNYAPPFMTSRQIAGGVCAPLSSMPSLPSFPFASRQMTGAPDWMHSVSSRQIAGVPYPIPPSLSGAPLAPIPLTRQNAATTLEELIGLPPRPTQSISPILAAAMADEEEDAEETL